jgi:hypothetical protein
MTTIGRATAHFDQMRAFRLTLILRNHGMTNAPPRQEPAPVQEFVNPPARFSST